MNYVVHWPRQIDATARANRWPQDYEGLCGSRVDSLAFTLGFQSPLEVTCPDCIATVAFRAEVERRCADQMEHIADLEDRLHHSRARGVALRALRRASGPHADPDRRAEAVIARERFLMADATERTRRAARFEARRAAREARRRRAS